MKLGKPHISTVRRYLWPWKPVWQLDAGLFCLYGLTIKELSRQWRLQVRGPAG